MARVVKHTVIFLEIENPGVASKIHTTHVRIHLSLLLLNSITANGNAPKIKFTHSPHSPHSTDLLPVCQSMRDLDQSIR